jgi:hypothetical protein
MNDEDENNWRGIARSAGPDWQLSTNTKTSFDRAKGYVEVSS